MIRAALICPDSFVCSSLEKALLEVGGVGILRVMERYPTQLELTRFVRAHAPQVIFLSFESQALATATREILEESFSGIQIIAVNRSSEPQLLLDVMRLGIREFLAPPFERRTLEASILRVRELLSRRPVDLAATDLLYCFLPAKAGVGASTIATSTAVAISRTMEVKTLLADFDLNSGIVRFLLKLTNAYSVIDATERSAELDENFWPQLVTQLGELDVLHAGKLNPNIRIEPIQMKHLIDFARRNYKVICADLSGNLEKYSLEIMHEAKRIFLVTTPELPALYLAREKYQYLQSLELGDRVSILLNRAQKKAAMTAEHVEELLGLKVYESFPNDYQGVTRAMTDGRPVDYSSALGRQCLNLAQSMLERKVDTGEGRRRFIEYFTLSPARYSLESKKTG
jgi:pilus assembly protein CpaE